MASRKPVFNQQVLYDTTPLPDSIPAVKEVGATSAPLLSAAFFIGDRCRPYNDDYMQCKTENPGKGEFECLKEGRRVTRCAASVYVDEPIPREFFTLVVPDCWGPCSIDDINKHCLEEFRKHWQCLDNNNHQLWQCRKAEWKLNQCVYDNLTLEKTIPDAPKDQIPVHLRTKQIYAHYPILRDPGQPQLGKSIESPAAKARAAEARAAEAATS
ncbi:NADH-ubiquinone oxidoreductase 20.8 kDa subunit [Xylaria sp. FL1042]|nr:NADH-ubiquinone oxidoreductase 20.8 kDa subunit [Xylaria sp. FL1042]